MENEQLFGPSSGSVDATGAKRGIDVLIGCHSSVRSTDRWELASSGNRGSAPLVDDVES
jgi:hypothetical protein